MKKRWIVWFAMFASLSLVAAACGGDEDGVTPEGTEPAAEKIPVTVYFQGALTGDFNYLVIHAFQAAQLRFDELNAEADFPAEVTLEQSDTQGDPEQAPPVVETAVGDPNTVAILGPGFSGESEASGDTYNEAGIPFLTPSATNPGLADKGWDFWYRGVANDDDQGTPIGERLAAEYGSVFVVHDKSTYGQGLADVVEATVESGGKTVAGVTGIEPTEDYSALISDIQASDAEAIFYGGYDAQTGLIVAQARDAGLDVPIYSGDGSVSSTLLDLAGDSATNVILSCPCNLEGAGDFLAKYTAEYGETGTPIYAAEGYDAASLVGEGIRSAVDGGASDPEGIRAGIKEYLDSLTEDAPFQGVAKTYAFDESHELAATDRKALIFFYTVSPGEIALEGSAADLVP